jgi:hypothetical protein
MIGERHPARTITSAAQPHAVAIRDRVFILSSRSRPRSF